MQPPSYKTTNDAESRLMKSPRHASVEHGGGALAGDVTDRFRAFHASQDHALLSALIADLAPLVQDIAGHYDRSTVPSETLRQSGYLGLLTAAACYDPRRGIPFAKFARRFIAREIRQCQRDGWVSVRCPRWLQELDSRLRRAVADLFQRLGRPPTLAEIAHAVNIAEPGVLEILRARSVVRAPVPVKGAAHSPIRRERIVHHHYVSFRLPIEDTIRVAEVVERLSAIQRKVIFFLFDIDRTQTDAARRLRESQRHVSPRHEPLVRLRDVLGPPRVLGPPQAARC